MTATDLDQPHPFLAPQHSPQDANWCQCGRSIHHPTHRDPATAPPEPLRERVADDGFLGPYDLSEALKATVEAVKQDPSVLEEAQSLIHGQRQKDYGSPATSLERIARLWTVYLAGDKDQRFGLSPQVSPDDVCWLMLLLKAARYQGGGGQRDSVVDACGYLGLIEILANEEGKVL